MTTPTRSPKAQALVDLTNNLAEAERLLERAAHLLYAAQGQADYLTRIDQGARVSHAGRHLVVCASKTASQAAKNVNLANSRVQRDLAGL